MADVTVEEVMQMKVAELRTTADSLGVSHKGLNKAPLQEAIVAELEARKKEGTQEAAAMEVVEEEGEDAESAAAGEESSNKEDDTQGEEAVVPLTAKNLEKQGLETRSCDTSDASRFATTDLSSVRDDMRSLSSVVAEEEGGGGRASAPLSADGEDKGAAGHDSKVTSSKPAPASKKSSAPPASPPKAKAPAPPQQTAAAVPSGKEQELLQKLREKKPAVKRNNTAATTSKEGGATKAPAPTSLNPVSCTIRVDGFIRPFTEGKAKALMAETGGGPLVQPDGFWMDSIKTHCYATFQHEEHAVQAREALYNLVWPERGGTLKADFAAITAADAGQHALAARTARLSGKPVPKAAAPPAVPPPSRTAPPTLAASASNGSLLSRSSSIADQEAAGVRRKRELGPSPDRESQRPREVDHDEEEASRPSKQQKVIVNKQPTFEDLFRSTTTKPKLYWQATSEDKVLVKRKKNAELKELEKERRARKR